MYRRLRENFGTAGLVVAIVALVAALGGAAIAANGGGNGKATASAKGKPGPRGKTGPAGPAGPAGPQGPAGAKGDAGSNGSNGSNGAAGPTGPTGPKGNTGNPGAAGLEGPTGPTGPTGSFGGGVHLEEGVTELGSWAASGSLKTIKDGDGNMVQVGSPTVLSSITFPVPLGGELFEYSVHIEGEPNFNDFDGGGPGTKGCNVDITLPNPPSKALCIYKGSNLVFKNMTLIAAGEPPFYEFPERQGAVLKLSVTGAEGIATGQWEITG